MNTIGNNTTLPVLPATQRVSVPTPRGTELPRESEAQATQQPEVQSDRVLLQRISAAREASQPVANSRVLGTDRFVMFRDAGGQVVTRIRGEDGKVKYIPEPQLEAKQNTGALVNLKA